MRERAPFRADDLAELDTQLLARATAVIPMQDVHDGNRDPNVIGMRHDIDNGHALATAVKAAEWSAERGYRGSYYILHTSPYWGAPGFRESLDRIAEFGHEIGIHTDALAASFVQERDPDLILMEAIDELRSYGFPVRGVAGHGNPLCNRDRNIAAGEITFANDEQFIECARPQEGLPDRWITRGDVRRRIQPRPLADFGLEYEALVLGLPHPWRISDSGGKWLNPGWDETCVRWDTRQDVAGRQLHFLWHAGDWWTQAFARSAVAA